MNKLINLQVEGSKLKSLVISEEFFMILFSFIFLFFLLLKFENGSTDSFVNSKLFYLNITYLFLNHYNYFYLVFLYKNQ